MPPRDDPSPTRWSDSPWAWFLLFAAMAIVALAVIGPKHVRRQQRLVRMQQARERAAIRQATGQPQDAEASPAAESPAEPEVSILPLLAFLMLLTVAVGTGLLITTRRRASRSAAGEKHPP